MERIDMFDRAGKRAARGALAVALLLGGCSGVGAQAARPSGSVARPGNGAPPDLVRGAEVNYANLYAEAELLFKRGALDIHRSNHWYCDAAARYSQVVEGAPAGALLQNAARASVISWQHCIDLDDERIESAAEAMRAIKEQHQGRSSRWGYRSTHAEDPLAKRAISDQAQKMIEVFGNYIAYLPEAPELVTIKYRLARIYYDYNYRDEAILLFKDLVENHPRSAPALGSAPFLLDCMAIKFSTERPADTDVKTIDVLVGKFLTMPELTKNPYFAELLRKIIVDIHQ